jgi:hypothetical protein
MERVDKPQSRVKRYATYAVIALLFGPFVLLYAGAFLGIGLPQGITFGLWFMAALTVCGMIAFIDLAVSSWRNKRNEFGCLIVIGLATFCWGSIFYKGLSKLMGW